MKRQKHWIGRGLFRLMGSFGLRKQVQLKANYLVKSKDIKLLEGVEHPYSVDLSGIETKNADAIVDTIEDLSNRYKTTIQGYRTGKMVYTHTALYYQK